MQRLSENSKTVLHLPLRSRDAAAVAAGLDTNGYDGALIVLAVGAMADSSTFDLKVQKAEAAAGPWTDIAGAAITQLTQAGGDADKVVTLDVRLGERAARPRWLRVYVTPAIDAVMCGVTVVLYQRKGVAGPLSLGQILNQETGTEGVILNLSPTSETEAAP